MPKVVHDSETPVHGQQVITVVGFIHKRVDGQPKVFLAKRAATKRFLPGLYEMPGGHVDYGEDIVAALAREVHEEFKVSIKVGDPFACFTYENAIKQSHSIEVAYFAVLEDREENISINPEDHSEYGWFSEEEIHATVIPNRKAANIQASIQSDTSEDFEVRTILKGFSILNGEPLTTLAAS